MTDFFKKNIATILLSLVFLVVGVIIGLNSKENQNGIYISANYMDGTSAISIGKTEVKLNEVDLSTLTDAESHVLAAKIKELNSQATLSSELRNMVKDSQGPFEAVNVDVNFHLISEEDVTGSAAKACKNTPVYNNSLVAYQTVVGGDTPLKIKGLLGLHAAKEQLANCDHQQDGPYDIWISKDYVNEWLVDPVAANVSDFKVKAHIVVTSFVL